MNRMQSEKFTEKEIIKGILAGEKALYEIIVRRFNPSLYKIGRSYNYNHQDTQDLMQETFIDAYKSLLQFEGRSDFKTWIIRIMMNNCFRRKRKSSFKNEIMQDINDQSTPMFANGQNDTDKIVQRHELGRVIEKALGKIPFDYRMVFSLREINGLNVAETAETLHISNTNVKVRLNRAKAMLRSEIRKYYSPNELFEFNLIYCDAMVENVMKKIRDL
ncbi:sigma-70 family RNA polymerase sigma factor [Parapedobacter sp. 10938]|uniref:sigma-70 family RNA polymerase sigma factor n=1 Tax=Parapedobacter flavus TaxID=3110225 RepID=UPI002DB61601|nr:sigma-70 family RNA polymerase sigma factor [Parapedobacter sp. 10938]MEC3880919.1 sigma-70 family RNA polymerase sigma factor [Parapedobacter sp. 10938]